MTQKSVSDPARVLKRLGRKLGKAMLNAPLAILGGLMLGAFACFSAGTIFETNGASLNVFGFALPLAPVEAVFDLGCGALAFLGTLAASAFATDPRREQRDRAVPAVLLALALIGIPVSYLANGFAFERQKADWKAYAGSEAEAADKAIVSDQMNDSQVKADASQRLQGSAKPTRAKAEAPDWLKAGVLHLLTMLAAGAFRREHPETEAQRQTRIDAEDRERRRLKRLANKAKKEREEKGDGNVFKFPKRA